MNETVTTVTQADPSLTWVPVASLVTLGCWKIGSALGDTVVVAVQMARRARGRMTARRTRAGGAGWR